jgi:hypothetical protein
MYKIAALRYLLDDCGSVFEAEYFHPIANKRMKQCLDFLIAKVRPQLIPLVETYGTVEEIIPTNIGNFYGDIYEQQLE